MNKHAFSIASTFMTVSTIMTAISGAVAEEKPAAVAQPFAVVELFTSEGCSSCPPADKLLAEFVGDARQNKHRIFPLAFHVDYWNAFGWSDPFSSKTYSLRQQDYLRAFRSANIYTPQMIVNGSEQFVGSDRAHALRAIEAALARPAKVGLTLRTKPESLTVHYELTKAPNGAALHIALVETGLSTKVGRGENSGRTLQHENVVRAFETVRLGNETSGEVTLKPPAGVHVERTTIIGYVQDPVTMAILGAASALSPPD